MKNTKKMLMKHRISSHNYFTKRNIFTTCLTFFVVLLVFVHFLFPEYKSVISFLEFLTMGEVIFMVWVVFKGAKLPSDEGGGAMELEAVKQ